MIDNITSSWLFMIIICSPIFISCLSKGKYLMMAYIKMFFVYVAFVRQDQLFQEARHGGILSGILFIILRWISLAVPSSSLPPTPVNFNRTFLIRRHQRGRQSIRFRSRYLIERTQCHSSQCFHPHFVIL
jgi:hypothetical protein